MDTKLQQARDYVQGFLRYRFQDINHLEEALWAYGGSLPNGRHLPDGNKSLAVLGDAVIYLIVKHDCYLKELAPGMAVLVLSLGSRTY